MSLHIVYVSEGFPPEADARAIRAFHHSRHWAKAGHRVTVLTKAPNHPYGKVYAGYRNRWHSMESLEGVEVRRLWSCLLPNGDALMRLVSGCSFIISTVVQSWRVQEADIVIATSPTPLAAFAGYCLSRLKKVPFVFEVRDLWPESLQGFSIRRRQHVITWLLANLAGFLYRKAALIACVTQGQMPIVQEGYHIAPEKICVIPNGTDISVFQRKGIRESFRKEQGWEDAFIVLYAGNHGSSHNLPFILQVAEKLRGNPNIRFVLVGEGSQKPALKQFKEDHGLENVIFYDQQPRQEIPAFYEAADICFIPLHAQFPYDHAMPVKLYESMAMGLPVLLAGRGEAAAMIEKTQAGVCVAPDDADAAANVLKGLATDPERLSAFTRNGPTFIAKHYTREKSAQALLRHLEALCPHAR